MATMVGKENDPVKLLEDLIQLDYDAIDAYEAAIERLKDVSIRAQMERFCEDHRRHVASLGALVGELGFEVPTKGDIKRVLTKGKVVIGGLFGDRAILMAMKANEDDTNSAYERACSRADLSPKAKDICLRNLADERRHRGWIESQLRTAESARPSHPSVV